MLWSAKLYGKAVFKIEASNVCIKNAIAAIQGSTLCITGVISVDIFILTLMKITVSIFNILCLF
ncbi:hypothetical protein PROVRETT_09475 [Providencia rettgeri DSM 1131]|nr:hypothetical protein PROVRETT_09475 [Providencia rettgeri DSM 1131]